jgi:hypothetical protein
LIALLIIIETEEFFIAMDSGWSMCLALLPKYAQTHRLHPHASPDYYRSKRRGFCQSRLWGWRLCFDFIIAIIYPIVKGKRVDLPLAVSIFALWTKAENEFC